ncbi:hypothetical protein LG299_10145 [Microbacterium lacus]|uniref:MarR family winged helix-turn-helix transcriptional regulator n=1 Tax=Microbacterium lacus TaxID=415217 RepID=UPI00384CA824
MNFSNSEKNPRPFGWWLRTVDALVAREFATAFEAEDITRRDWMLLSVLSGDIDRPGLAERIARKGKRLDSLAERGWIARDAEGTWALTPEGTATKERLGAVVEGIRSRVAGAVSPEDFATTMASLEAIARELGWDESAPMNERGFGRRRHGFGPRGFGPDLGRGFRPGFGGGGHRGREYAERGDFRPEPVDQYNQHKDFGPGHGRHRAHHRGQHRAEQAFERGFAAGFAAAAPADVT